MKRLHVHVSVSDLEGAVRFYSHLFGADPSVLKSDYAKWAVDDPRVNFAISTGQEASGLDHLGIQVEDAAELDEVEGRLREADAKVLEQRGASCCYAESDKSWSYDPDGLAWETFLTHGAATEYGGDRRVRTDGTMTIGEASSGGACCRPAE